ncbi:MAG: hypothetical protein FJ034_05190 [Chloroflexi bacterium]|nr:hypothetical protein [Chloroflexota bacterium]
MLGWTELRRDDGAVIDQASARNNSWYMIVPEAGAFTLRYASQSGSYVLARNLTKDAARAEAERHADRYDTRT